VESYVQGRDSSIALPVTSKSIATDRQMIFCNPMQPAVFGRGEARPVFH
jgi:hypothetical protein